MCIPKRGEEERGKRREEGRKVITIMVVVVRTLTFRRNMYKVPEEREG